MIKMKRKNNLIITVREAHEDDATVIKKIFDSVVAEKYCVVPERSWVGKVFHFRPLSILKLDQRCL
ncbi:MAG: hypothetical protein OEW62_06520 [Candidatus Bathyarchaeota archaeon]|nr:hypothetical protein [Candidatus Bathyarchaeota archaeon]